MAVVFAGGEFGDFDEGVVGGHDGFTTRRDADFSRTNMNMTGGAGHWLARNFGPEPEAWAKLMLATGTTANTSGQALIQFTSQVRFAGTGTAGEVALQRWNGTGWIDIARATGAFATTGVHPYVLQARIATNGALRGWLGGALVGEFLGDTTALGQVGRLFISPASTSTSHNRYFSEIIVATHDIRAARLRTLPLTAAGAASEWAGAMTNINGAETPDSSFISSATPGARSLFAKGSLGPDTLEVDALVISSRVRRNEGGPSGADGLVRVGGGDHGRNLGALTGHFRSLQAIYGVNPATGALWTRADAAAAEIGVRART